MTSNLTQQLTHTLGEAIVAGVYGVGLSMPSEAVLCEQFNISRSATREAVKMLSAKGLISSRPRQGIRVNPEKKWNLFDTDVLEWILKSKPSLNLLREFTQVRFAIEPVAAKLAAENATPIQIKNMEQALIRISQTDDIIEDQLDAHLNFLNTMLLASGNRFFIQLTQFVNAALRVSIRYVNDVKGVSNTDVTFHSKVFEAIKNGDADTAHQAVHDILTDALNVIEARL
ncbi:MULTISPECIES: FadR/GntR family transcriptional regulator [Aliiglaciecola]|uniref:FadR/GntR family transcriptional regulator n=1 Tax=Aliiglaciecola TaxID=1406885 RepID=UPI001C09AE48|nr:MULTISPECIES: FadR/GntR family transcriptional regulator [Aliiglaciecola]MBU2876672.1 FadR family transcriptional regulator [Aliiglaciecola lipolytica]MDO6710263.1 FadR/GntR family transcriptional regulator [Aliiglaciecola sp. 2_MG-2023]MDO6751411.1 FadR/GntR family transcriptional regulator [Aliiglaciecola sp. 1_MG-2023]